MATPRKSTATPRVALPSSASKSNGLPTAHLDRWLDGRHAWNHDDWLALLAALRAAGFAHLTDTATGQTAIGEYLETHRQ